MKRKCTLLVVIFAVSILIGIQAVEVVEANPVPWPSTPNLEKPTIRIDAPQNNTAFAYNATDVWLNFTIAKPDSWIIPHLIPIPSVRVESVKAQLDGNHVSLGGYNGGYSVKLNLSQSVPGLHTLNVTVLLYSYYRGAAYNGSHVVSDIMSSSGPVYQYSWVASEIIYFTLQQPTQRAQDTQPAVSNLPSPTPSQSMPTINTGTALPVELNPLTVVIILAIVIAIVAVALVSLVYFKRRGKP